MLGKYNRRTVSATSGEIVPNATVNFYWQQTGLPATVYADPDGNSPLGGSVLSDESGAIGVFLQPGRYRVVVTLGGDILEEVTWEPVVNELATAQTTDFIVKLAEMPSPAETSYLRTLSSGFSEHRSISQVRSDLSINNVNNTSDANKPISTATLAALNGKINATEKGANNGVATLNAIGLIPPEQLPSYVDDVIERANYAALPATGETGKIYITTDNNKQYRWGGSTYIELVSSPGSTDALAEGSTNKYFTEARVRATVLTGYTNGSNATLASTDTILAALGKVQGQLNAKATSAQGTKADSALQPGANISSLTNNSGFIGQAAGDARYAGRENNLADLDSASSARTNLGLGTAARANVTASSTDTTVGRMLQVGDGGVNALVVAAIADTNAVVAGGMYYCTGSTLNTPIPSSGTLFHQVTDNTTQQFATQLFIAVGGSVATNANRIFIRHKDSGIWEDWHEIWHTGNLSTTLVGYLSGLTFDVQAQIDAKASATVDQNVRNASYTLAITDNGKHLYHSNASAYTWTIPPNSSVAFPVGATVTFVNDASGTITIAQGSGVTIVFAGSGLTGNRTLAQYGMVTALKVGTNRWYLSGTGVS